VCRTSRGEELLTLSAEIFTTLRAEWAAQLGERRMAQIEDDLERIGAGHPLSAGADAGVVTAGAYWALDGSRCCLSWWRDFTPSLRNALRRW
jgi:hypothetical protein